MNPLVHLRMVGKRWRQARTDGEPGYFPIVSHHMTFTDVRIQRASHDDLGGLL
jgi:hypothetical protein